MNSTMPKPTTFQVIEITTAQKARSALANQTIGWRDEAQVDEQLVEQADLFVEQPEPEQARTRETDHHGQENDGAGEPLERRVVRRQQRQRKAEDHQDRRQNERVFDREHERAPEAGIVPDPT